MLWTRARRTSHRFAPVSATTCPPLPVFGGGDSNAVGSGAEALAQTGPTASNLLLPVRVVDRGRVADQRGAQVGAAGCGSQRGHSHRPPNKVRQDPPGSAAYFHSGR